MRTKLYILFIVTTCTSLIGYGQFNKYCQYTDYAIKAYQNNDFEKAVDLMDSAIKECPDENNTAVNWYNLSLFYKAIYKNEPSIELREIILKTTLKAKELDVANELLDNINSSIRNIAIQYKNDAILLLNDTLSNFNEVVSNLNNYKKLNSMTDSTKTYTAEDIQFYTVMAQKSTAKYNNSKTANTNYLDSAVFYYQKVLQLDENSGSTYEQLGILFFNQAVDIVNNMDEEASLEEVMSTDVKKAELALKSIPYFKKALEITPANSNLIYSLAGCYELLSLKEEHHHYLNLLKEKDPDYYKEVYTYPSN